jgi:hypothetical protein
VAVPKEVRDAALAAFSARHPNRALLDLLRDDLEDLDEQDGDGEAHRHLLFGDAAIRVRVEVRYSALLTELTVHVPGGQPVELEVLGPDPDLRLVVRGGAPLRVATAHRGPTALLITGTSAGSTVQWQTAWVAL